MTSSGTYFTTMYLFCMHVLHPKHAYETINRKKMAMLYEILQSEFVGHKTRRHFNQDFHPTKWVIVRIIATLRDNHYTRTLCSLRVWTYVLVDYTICAFRIYISLFISIGLITSHYGPVQKTKAWWSPHKYVNLWWIRYKPRTITRLSLPRPLSVYSILLYLSQLSTLFFFAVD